MNSETIKEIGKWCIRLALVVGAVVTSAMGNKEIASACVAGVVVSFWMLD